MTPKHIEGPVSTVQGIRPFGFTNYSPDTKKSQWEVRQFFVRKRETSQEAEVQESQKQLMTIVNICNIHFHSTTSSGKKQANWQWKKKAPAWGALLGMHGRYKAPMEWLTRVVLSQSPAALVFSNAGEFEDGKFHAKTPKVPEGGTSEILVRQWLSIPDCAHTDSWTCFNKSCAKNRQKTDAPKVLHWIFWAKNSASAIRPPSCNTKPTEGLGKGWK